MEPIDYSIVIPVFNEESVLHELYKRLANVMSSLSERYEIIFVDDNSDDSTCEILQELRKKDKRIKIIRFSRNFGHQMAISAGLKLTEGDAVIVMDGDLQDPPELIKQFVEKWREGNDVVYAIRKKRKEGMVKKVCYKTFYRLLKLLSNLEIPQDTGDFGFMSRKVVDLLINFPERQPFLRGLRSWVGFKQVGIEYERDQRFSGESKYSLKKLINLAADGFFGFSLFPLRVAVILGFLFSIVGIGLIFLVVYLRIFTHSSVPGFASTAILIILFSGIQLIILGVLGEYIGRIHTQVNMRPKYIIKETIGIQVNQQIPLIKGNSLKIPPVSQQAIIEKDLQRQVFNQINKL